MSLRNHIYYPDARKAGYCRICGWTEAKCKASGTEDPAWMELDAHGPTHEWHVGKAEKILRDAARHMGADE